MKMDMVAGSGAEGQKGRREGERNQLELTNRRDSPPLLLSLTLFFSSLSQSLNSVDLRLIQDGRNKGMDRLSSLESGRVGGDKGRKKRSSQIVI